MKKLAPILVTLLLAGTARADDEGKLSLVFSSNTGLTGMREMIDARVPDGTLNVRGMARFEHDSLNLESRAFAHSNDVYAGELLAGASAFGMLDAGLRYPFQIRRVKDDIRGLSSKVRTVTGVADPELSAKVGFRLGPISIAPYATTQFATGNKWLEHTDEWNLGLAAAGSLLNERVAIHANITWVKTFVHFGPGKFAFGYRLGGSVVPWADDFLVLRLYGFLDGLEYGGTPGSAVRMTVGAQALFFKHFIAEVGTYVKLEDGDLPTHLENVATYGMNFTLGVQFGF